MINRSPILQIVPIYDQPVPESINCPHVWSIGPRVYRKGECISKAEKSWDPRCIGRMETLSIMC
jgi:hypothetical protein